MKLFDSELKVMNVIWQYGEVSAVKIAEILGKEIGWSKTTTYTVIKKCLEKGAIHKSAKGYICTAAVSKESVQMAELEELEAKLFDNSEDMLLAALLRKGKMSKEKLEALEAYIDGK